MATLDLSLRGQGPLAELSFYLDDPKDPRGDQVCGSVHSSLPIYMTIKGSVV